MRRNMLSFSLLLSIVTAWTPAASFAHDADDNNISRKLLTQEALPNIPEHTLTTITVRLPPGEVAAPHQHDAFLFVYLLEGSVRSQLDDEAPVDYVAGESWTEQPGAVHTMTQNLSDTEPATLLVVFVGKTGATLTTTGAIDQ